VDERKRPEGAAAPAAGGPQPRRVRFLGEPLGPGELFVVAGPCVIEGEAMLLDVARSLRETAARLGLRLVFKASYAKANRSAVDSFSGIGDRAGLAALRRVREETGLPVLTDVHETSEAAAAAEACDVLQIPAFLSRQTRLLQAAAGTGRPVNVKKGQFLAPGDMARAVEKIRAARPGAEIWLTERGTTFGYHDLVVDMRSFPLLRAIPGVAVVYDVTHSLQHPGVGGDRRFARPLARAALAAGADGLFLETHPDPPRALSDPTTQLPLAEVGDFLAEMLEWKRLQARWVDSPGGAPAEAPASGAAKPRTEPGAGGRP